MIDHWQSKRIMSSCAYLVIVGFVLILPPVMGAIGKWGAPTIAGASEVLLSKLGSSVTASGDALYGKSYASRVTMDTTLWFLLPLATAIAATWPSTVVRRISLVLIAWMLVMLLAVTRVVSIFAAAQMWPTMSGVVSDFVWPCALVYFSFGVWRAWWHAALDLQEVSRESLPTSERVAVVD